MNGAGPEGVHGPHAQRPNGVPNRRRHPAGGSAMGSRLPLRGHGLPLLLSSFVGREEAKDEVAGLVRASGLVTLTGPGGIGKSRLALEVAAELADEGQPLAFVDLSVVANPASVLSAVATALGLSDSSSGSLLEAVVAYLGDPTLLLVLDSCEHLAASCAWLAQELLGACSGLKILATSRRRLGAQGEVVWRVPPLSLPREPADLPRAFVDSEAVRLFCERAAALCRGFLPSGENVAAVAEICRRLDANPLAIELAAARVVALPPAEIAARLGDRFSLLEAGASTAPARQRTLRATVDWSYQLLSLPERALLRRLSVFTGSFGVDAAEAVCGGGDVEAGQVVGLLTGLVEKSLVVNAAMADVARYRLSETVRAYAVERLEEVGETAELAERHAAWCLGVVEGGPADYGPAAAEGEWLARLDAEQDNIRAALEWALATERAELALRLARGQMPLWQARGCHGEARQCLERVLATTGAAPQVLRAEALHDAGFAAFMAGDVDAARSHLRASLALSGEGPDPASPVRTRTLLAFISSYGENPASIEDVEQAAESLRDTGDDALLAEAFAACGHARMVRGEPGPARRHFEESLEAARRAGHESLAATSLVGVASAELAQGDYSRAQGHLHESVAIAARSGDTHTEVVAKTWLAELAHISGRHEEARTGFEECLERARAMDAPYPLARSLLGLGRAVLEGGDSQAALPLFDEAAAAAESPPLADLAVRALTGRAQAALALGEVASARSDLDKALSQARAGGDKVGEALALQARGHLDWLEGDLAAAAGYRQALVLHAQVGDPAAIAGCLDALGTLAAIEDDFCVTARLLAAADSVRGRHGSAQPPLLRPQRVEAIESARQALGEEAFSDEWHQGAGLSTDAAVGYARKQGRRREPRAPAVWEALTPAEQRVAALAAGGLSNAEIARELVVSRRTVETHLQRAYVKLGITSRRDLPPFVRSGKGTPT